MAHIISDTHLQPLTQSSPELPKRTEHPRPPRPEQTMTAAELNHSLDHDNETLWTWHDCAIELDEKWRRIFLFLLYLFCFMVGLLENALVVWVNWRRRHSATFFPVVGRRRWIFCGGLWAFSFFLALLENVHVDLLELDEPGCYLMPEKFEIQWFVSMSVLRLFFQFLLPSAVIITCNVLIARALRTAPDVQDRRNLWLVHVYSLVFVMCWFPFHLATFLMVLDELYHFLFSCRMIQVLYFSLSVVDAISLLHCVANPILYNFLSKSFRNNLINAVVDSLPREATQPHVPNGGDLGKQRKLSNASTSQSDVGS
ncbi:hypothetical protein fugu_006792 [Takifugu bimaculatus]|uniref:G-protein coupled receptors family 1 profile domain-containing protein n=1 Tax=Takifugu bimaculatus TaxID=433685 RepID=A0A4Z2B2H6_9TELE|nr:hypothetical protein fugu_006792 [Takifugu bimaculatus]